MNTTIIDGAEEFAALEPAWWDLLGRVPEAPPFLAPAWLLPWWEVFGPGALHIVVVWDGGRLTALAPLYTEEGPRGRRLLPIGIGLSDVLDVLVDPAVPEAGHELTAALAAHSGRWDCWSAEEAPLGARVLELPPPAGWTARAAPQSACPVLDLPFSATACGQIIPSGKARKLRMAHHRTGRRDAVLERSTAATVSANLAALFHLHAMRWQGRGEAGVLADQAVQRFHTLAAPRLFEAGLLRLNVLRIDDQLAGVYYGLRQGATHYAYLGGFDPAFAFESPGTVLMGDAIDDALSCGARAFNFLRGQEPYKYDWGAVDRWSQCRTFEPPL